MTGSNGPTTPVSTRVMNLAHFLTQVARRHPGAIGFVWGDEAWTWAQMEARVEAMAAALATRFGVGKGDRVLVQSANCNQMFESMFACFRLGAVWVDPVSGWLRLGVPCACHAVAYAFRPGIVVIDIRNGPPPTGSGFENAIDRVATGPLPPLADRAVPRPRKRPGGAGPEGRGHGQPAARR